MCRAQCARSYSDRNRQLGNIQVVVEDGVVLNQHEEKLKCMRVNSQVLVEVKGVIFFEKFNNQANLATL